VRPFAVRAVPPSIVEVARSGNAALIKVMVSVGIVCASLAGKRVRLTRVVRVLIAFATVRPKLVQSTVLGIRERKVDLCLRRGSWV